jgi:hypothetical protein
LLEVGLIGAPGAGKSSTAAEVANRLMLDVIGPPASSLLYQDRAVGQLADYIVNLEIALLRHHAICEKRYSSRPFVTDGTLIDSLAYAGLRAEDVQSEVPTQIIRNQLLREMHAAVLIGCMMLDAQHVENLFYLPLVDRSDFFASRVDAAIADTIETYKVPVIVVTGDNPAEQILERLEKNAPHA